MNESKEKDVESGDLTATAATAADINTRAYENVKNTWTKRAIWDRDWAILPGMSWKHNDPREDEIADDPAPIQADPLGNGSRTEAGGAPTARISGSPSPIERNHRHASVTMKTPQRGQFAGT